MHYKAGGKHWVLDSGCMQHITGYVKMFTSLDEDVGDHEHVTFGDNSKGRVVGLGKVAITKDLSISNVLLVESVSFNFLSIAQLCDLGLICTFSDSEVIVTSKEDKSLIFKGFDMVTSTLLISHQMKQAWRHVFSPRTPWVGFGIAALLILA